MLITQFNRTFATLSVLDNTINTIYYKPLSLCSGANCRQPASSWIVCSVMRKAAVICGINKQHTEVIPQPLLHHPRTHSFACPQHQPLAVSNGLAVAIAVASALLPGPVWPVILRKRLQLERNQMIGWLSQCLLISYD